MRGTHGVGSALGVRLVWLWAVAPSLWWGVHALRFGNMARRQKCSGGNAQVECSVVVVLQNSEERDNGVHGTKKLALSVYNSDHDRFLAHTEGICVECVRDS